MNDLVGALMQCFSEDVVRGMHCEIEHFATSFA